LPWQLSQPADYTNKLEKTSVFFNQPPPQPPPKTVLAAAPLSTVATPAKAASPQPTKAIAPAVPIAPATKPVVSVPSAKKQGGTPSPFKKPAPARKPTNVDSLDATYNR
jgi:hypothetical protein